MLIKKKKKKKSHTQEDIHKASWTEHGGTLIALSIVFLLFYDFCYFFRNPCVSSGCRGTGQRSACSSICRVYILRFPFVFILLPILVFCLSKNILIMQLCNQEITQKHDSFRDLGSASYSPSVLGPNFFSLFENMTIAL